MTVEYGPAGSVTSPVSGGVMTVVLESRGMTSLAQYDTPDVVTTFG